MHFERHMKNPTPSIYAYLVKEGTVVLNFIPICLETAELRLFKDRAPQREEQA